MKTTYTTCRLSVPIAMRTRQPSATKYSEAFASRTNGDERTCPMGRDIIALVCSLCAVVVPMRQAAGVQGPPAAVSCGRVAAAATDLDLSRIK